MLIVGSYDGQIQGFTFPLIESSDKNAVTSIIPTQHEIWMEQDKIAPTYIDIWSWCNGYLLVAAKGAFFLAFFLDKQGNKQSYGAYRCSDISVNGKCLLQNIIKSYYSLFPSSRVSALCIVSKACHSRCRWYIIKTQFVVNVFYK